MGVELRGPGCKEVKDGDKVAGMDGATILRVEDVEELLHRDFKHFPCQVHGCKEVFSQLHANEAHYNSVHRHSCSVCKRSLPSPHLLEIHIQETHDSFFSVLSEKVPSYQCFLPSCLDKFWGPETRHDHCIKDHKFPSDFRFDQVKKKPRNKKKDRAKDKEKEMKNTNREKDTNVLETSTSRRISLANMGIPNPISSTSSNKWSSSMDVSIVNDRSTNMASPSPPPTDSSGSKSGQKSRIPVLRSSSCRVPRQPSFGAGVARTFVRGRAWYQKPDPHAMETGVDIEHVDMTPLGMDLP